MVTKFSGFHFENLKPVLLLSGLKTISCFPIFILRFQKQLNFCRFKNSLQGLKH